MTDITDLIARLRSWDHCWPAKWLEPAVQQAADQLEALHQQLADAEAAAALVVERAAAKAREWAENYSPGSDGRNTFVMYAEWVEPLADPTGVEALAALRADLRAAISDRDDYEGWWLENKSRADQLSADNAALRARLAAAEADYRARIAAALDLTAVAGLVEAAQNALDGGYISSSIEEERADHDRLSAALARFRGPKP